MFLFLLDKVLSSSEIFPFAPPFQLLPELCLYDNGILAPKALRGMNLNLKLLRACFIVSNFQHICRASGIQHEVDR